MEMMPKNALGGVRIVELGPYMALPLTGRILGSLGAEVIKIDSHGALDDVYFIPNWAPGCGQPEYQATKKRITLNLRRREGADILMRLLEISDVFMTNVRKDALNKMGIGLERLQEMYPRLIILWQGGFGGKGPYAGYKLYGNLVQHAAGITASTGFPGSAPTAINTSYSDWHCGVFQPLAIIGALQRREQTGKGALIESGIFTSGVVTAGPALLDFQANRRLPEAKGNQDPCAAPHGAYPCKGEDEYCALSVFTDDQWESFCDVLEMRELVADPKFATMVERIKNADELDNMISAHTIEYDKYDLMKKLQAAGVPACIVSKGRDLYESQHLNSHNFYKEIPYYIPDRQIPGQEWKLSPQNTIAWTTPVHLSKTEWDFGNFSRIGEYNQYVFGELLSMSPEEIKKLEKEEIIY